MDTRYIFQYNNDYMVEYFNKMLDYLNRPHINKLNDNEKWYASGDPECNMVNDLSKADIMVYPSEEWMNNKNGSIIEVEVDIRVKDK